MAARELGELGARHTECGVTEEMYGWVAETLVDTLARVAGARRGLA